MSDKNTLAVKILDKEYLVACPEDKQAELREASNQLDSKMREIRTSGKVYGTERIAVMAALNLTYELMQNNAVQIGSKNTFEALEAQMDALLTKSEA